MELTAGSKAARLPVVLAALAAWCLSPVAVVGQDSVVNLPGTIPLFPLPDVTLFPHTVQPFHIFEPRYRSMVEDALAGDSIIGMVLLRPGFEPEYEGRPPVYDVGCAGIIVSSQRLPDGRYNILLRGLTKFRILGEDADRLYRVAGVESIIEAVTPDERAQLSRRRRQLEDALRSAALGSEVPRPGLSDEEAIDGLSLSLPLAPAQRQALLEAPGPIERALALSAMIRPAARAQ
ncbi:MAG: LON peptidase substrate-binding domain-containing protein [Gemmatimonadales bacterium]